MLGSHRCQDDHSGLAWVAAGPVLILGRGCTDEDGGELVGTGQGRAVVGQLERLEGEGSGSGEGAG